MWRLKLQLNSVSIWTNENVSFWPCQGHFVSSIFFFINVCSKNCMHKLKWPFSTCTRWRSKDLNLKLRCRTDSKFVPAAIGLSSNLMWSLCCICCRCLFVVVWWLCGCVITTGCTTNYPSGIIKISLILDIKQLTDLQLVDHSNWRAKSHKLRV